MQVSPFACAVDSHNNDLMIGADSASDELQLTDTHRMLLAMRDTLYEGSWEDFVRDLRARMESRPYVFDSVPTSPTMERTMHEHLALIERMRQWEESRGQLLRA